MPPAYGEPSPSSKRKYDPGAPVSDPASSYRPAPGTPSTASASSSPRTARL